MRVLSAEDLLLKGIEEEVYTGTLDGRVVGMSHEIAADLADFTTEPDCRNAEYAAPPIKDYAELGQTLLSYRRTLRQYLKNRGDYTLLPGASLALGNSNEFILSNPNNPYYRHIRDTYGANVVTASTHINIGIENPETLIRAYRVLRAEAAMYLALSASSPFIDGKDTGVHSYRWHVFPMTPADVPFFSDHAHYVRWIEEQLEAGSMFNVRHLWLSARPNGTRAPHEIQRLELRICDRIDNLNHLLAVIALVEARVHEIVINPAIDPLACQTEPQLKQWAQTNEAAAARNSLDAELVRWEDGSRCPASAWIEERVDAAEATAENLGFAAIIRPIREILAKGNTAQQWRRKLQQGQDVPTIYAEALRDATHQEAEIEFSPLQVAGASL